MEEITDKNELFEIADIYELFEWINDQLALEIIDDIVNKVTNSKSDSAVNVYTVINACHKHIKESVNSFFKNNNIDAKCTEQAYNELCSEFAFSDYGDAILDTVNERINSYFNDKTIDEQIENANELNDLKDEVGITTGIIDGNTIDMFNRDGTFIVIDGQLIIGDEDSTHAALINKYIQENLNEEVNEELNYFRVRDTELFDKIDDNVPIAFGHIIGNNAIIETCENCSIDDIIPILKRNKFNKVYSYNYHANAVTRLAKLELDSLQNIDEINKYIERISVKSIGYSEFFEKYIVENNGKYELINIPDTDILDNLPIFSVSIAYIKEHFGVDFKDASQDEIVNELKQEFALSDEMMELSSELNNEASDYLKKLLRDKEDKEKHLNMVDVTKLQELDDSIGEESRMLDEIDYGNRNAAFMDLDGEILISKSEETHAQLINRYLEEHNKDKKLDDDFFRPTSDEIEDTCDIDRVAFGHIIGYIWIIDTYSISNMSVDDVINDIKDSGKTFSKIYSLSMSGDKVKRLAKMQCMR